MIQNSDNMRIASSGHKVSKRKSPVSCLLTYWIADDLITLVWATQVVDPGSCGPSSTPRWYGERSVHMLSVFPDGFEMWNQNRPDLFLLDGGEI